MTEPSDEPDFEAAPRSATIVFQLAAADGPMTAAEISEPHAAARKTIDNLVFRLRGAGLVRETGTKSVDNRQRPARLYELAVGPDSDD